MTGSIAVPCNADQVTAGCDADRTFATLSPHLVDVGINYLVIVSPVNCAAVQETTDITNASVRYYLMSTVQETGIWSKGWTCNDLPTTWNWQPDSANSWIYP